MAGNITLKISSDVSQAVKGIDSVNKSLQQMQKSTETASSKFAKFTTAFIGAKGVFKGSVQIIGKVKDAVAKLLSSYSTQEKAEMRLQSTLKATQNACGMTASEMIFAMWKNIFS